MRQDAYGRYGLPEDQNDDTGEDGVESRIFAAKSGGEQGEQYNNAESRHEAEADHKGADNAADGHGQGQC